MAAQHSHQLTHDDRCDRCGGQAQVRAVLRRGELLFCLHHARRYRDELARQAMVVQEAMPLVGA